MAISAEQLNVILSARDKEFQRKMRDAERRVQHFKSKSTKNLTTTAASFDTLAMAAKRFLPALGAGIIIGQVKQITAEMDEIGKKADQIGITTDALQELRFVAEGAGVSQQKFTSSLERFSKRLGEAEMGTGAAKKVLEEMGLEASQLASIPLDQALKVVADEMAKIENPTDRAAKAAAIFGREGVAMVNMLRDGGDALSEMQKAANDAGAVIDEDLIRSAEEAQTRLDAASRIIRAQLSTALAELAPILVGAAEGFASIVKGVVSAIQAVDRFLDPQSDLEQSISNTVLAMGDEIAQSKVLEIALGRSSTMSVDAAKKKLEEAKARNENAKAAYNERAAILASLGASIADLETKGEGGGRSARGFELAAERLKARRDELLASGGDIDDQLARTEENIAKLEAAIANSGGGQVQIGDGIPDAIDLTDRLSGSAGRAATNVDDLTQSLQGIIQASPALQSLGFDADNLSNIMGKVESGMEDAFMSMIDGTGSAKDAFRSMAQDIIKELYRVLVVQQLVGSFESGGGGILGAVFGAFGGGGAPITGNAAGGTVQAGVPSITGEHGRELFVPQVNGRVMTTAQTKAMTGNGGGGSPVQVNYHFQGGVTEADLARVLPKLVESTKREVVNAVQRGGSIARAFQ